MKKNVNACIITSLSLAVGLLSFGFSNPPSLEWRKAFSPTYGTKVNVVKTSGQQSALVCIGGHSGVFCAEDNLIEFKSFFSTDAPQLTIADIHIFSRQPSHVLIATNKGLYESKDAGRRWERIFFRSEKEVSDVRTILANDEEVFVGTGSGVYWRARGDEHWLKLRGELGRLAIIRIDASGHYIFVATATKIYRIDQRSRVETVLTLGVQREEKEDTDDVIRDIHVTRGTNGILFVGSTRGIYLSSDQGNSWRQIILQEAPLDRLTAILPIFSAPTSHGRCHQYPLSCMDIFLATTRGAYLYQNGTARPVYKGMETRAVYDLALGKRGEVLAATDGGLYYTALEHRAPTPAPGAQNYAHIKQRFHFEPTIKEVHQMAIHYAEVHPQKISGWRKQARLKALVPSLSAGVDRNGSDRFHWDSGQSPDVLQEGDDYIDWDVSVSWDLSDLVWSSDQTSIDARSKLMVELREDILDQITRLYFERRRLQIELLRDEGDALVRFDKQMRIDELTALIDALTGGSFSREIKTEN